MWCDLRYPPCSVLEGHSKTTFSSVRIDVLMAEIKPEPLKYKAGMLTLHTVLSMKITGHEIYTNVIKFAINTLLPF